VTEKTPGSKLRSEAQTSRSASLSVPAEEGEVSLASFNWLGGAALLGSASALGYVAVRSADNFDGTWLSIEQKFVSLLLMSVYLAIAGVFAFLKRLSAAYAIVPIACLASLGSAIALWVVSGWKFKLLAVVGIVASTQGLRLCQSAVDAGHRLIRYQKGAFNSKVIAAAAFGLLAGTWIVYVLIEEDVIPLGLHKARIERQKAKAAGVP
jgi:hypothetical protein